jgi:AraC-like DNA-binding protein
VDVEGAARLPGGGGQLGAREARQQVGERDASLEPRQRRPEAEVEAVAEGDVGVGIARDVEALGVGELPGVAYQLWHRLLRGLGAFARMTASEAAHASGFADLAHFSRTCRWMLGGSPTAIRDRLLPA